jgi:hypothetical protein
VGWVERERENMISNIELLKKELKKRKQGNVQQTIDEVVVKFNRNKKNMSESFKALGQAGFIKVAFGTWKYEKK